MLKHKNVLCGVDAESTFREFSLFSEFIFPTTLSPTHSSPFPKPSSFFIRNFYIVRVFITPSYLFMFMHHHVSCIAEKKMKRKRFPIQFRAESGNKKLAQRCFLLFPTVWWWKSPITGSFTGNNTLILNTFSQRGIRMEKSWIKPSLDRSEKFWSSMEALLLWKSIWLWKPAIEYGELSFP